MIAIYRNNILINLVSLDEWFNMTNASLVSTESEFVVCSLID
jgi:hypothetical protein